MTQNTLKQAIKELGQIKAGDDTPLIDILRPWMLITDLTFQDALHIPHHVMVTGLQVIHSQLFSILDIMDEDQIQEAACRCLRKIKVYSEPITEDGVTVHPSHLIVWDGALWHYTANAKLRQRDSVSSYKQALAAVRALIKD